MSVETTSSPRTGADGRGRRLESWKEIAAYLGGDVAPVRRWEKGEGLPVYRLLHSRLGSLYAYTAELDAWRNERAFGAAPCASDSRSVSATIWLAGRARKAMILMGLILMVATGVMWFARANQLAASPAAHRERHPRARRFHQHDGRCGV